MQNNVEYLYTTFIFLATSSSDYAQYWTGALPGMYGPQFAVDASISYANQYFFHSGYEMYPFLKIALSAAKTVTAVRLQTRCDAKQWWHYQDIEWRTGATGDITFIPGMKLTTGTLCGNMRETFLGTCLAKTLVCAAAVADQQELSVQQMTLDSDGGGWTEHSSTAAYFLMANEIYIY